MLSTGTFDQTDWLLVEVVFLPSLAGRQSDVSGPSGKSSRESSLRPRVTVDTSALLARATRKFNGRSNVGSLQA